MAFDTVLDLTEAEMIECLRVVVAHQSGPTAVAAAEDAMDVDVDVDLDQPQAQLAPAITNANTTGVPSLLTFLNLVASYPTSRGPLLVALRRYLKDAGEITRILEVISGWLKQQTQVNENLLPTNKDMKKTEKGVWVVVGRKPNKRSQIPALHKVSCRTILLVALF